MTAGLHAEHDTEAVAELMQKIAQLQSDVRELRSRNSSLVRDLAEAKLGGDIARETRRAALNLMEDAVQARSAEQAENAERKRAEDQLRMADRRKDEFLATLAHELRNPLAPLRSGLYILKISDCGGETTRSVHAMLERQMTHLVRLVDDLLDVSRVTRGELKLRMEETTLSSVVSSAIEASRPLIEQLGQELVVQISPEPVTLVADPIRITQVITNLLNNAAKYSDRGGRIRIAASRDDSQAVISIRDTGLGISADMLPHVFELFTQVDRTLDRSQGGLGIGLTLVRTLVEAHGGTVEGASEGIGRGSEFTIRLPLRPHGETARITKSGLVAA